MRFALFQGCNIPARIEQYSRSISEVFQVLGVQLEISNDYTCCGYPIRNIDEKAYLLPSIRNLAVAEKAGLDLIVMCNCCYNSLRKAQVMVAKDDSLLAEFNSFLKKEGLHYSGKSEVKHYLAVLDDIGLETIRPKLTQVMDSLKVAVLHGCHVIRPREVTNFDDSFVPRISKELLGLIFAESVDWQGGMECCGAPLAGFNDELAMALLEEKITGAKEVGADYIMPFCSYCYLQLDEKQVHQKIMLPVLLFPQLLGLCMGIDSKKLGIIENKTIVQEDLDSLKSKLCAPESKKKKRRKAKVKA